MAGFENNVLSACEKIPRGKVATYAQIAQLIGSPKAARAVGTALSKNKNLITTPCHRVVRSDGRIGGYARGSKRKREVLILEGVRVMPDNKVDLQKFGLKNL